MAFKEIVGQQKAIDFFRSSVENKRLAHAYLFLGPQGIGKTLLAKNLAKFVNCTQPVKGENHEADCCDQCISCRKIEDSNHPDVLWIEPGKSAKISIDRIRALQREISLTPYEGRWKIFIILEAQLMTEEAANSLLKTLEEPPSSSLIILTSTGTSSLLPTIISRCQIVKFSLIAQQRLEEILTQRCNKATNVHFLAAQAEGRIGRALELADQDILDKKNRLIEQICQSRRSSSVADTFEVKNKRELANQIRYLLNWFRDILVLKAGLASSFAINADRIEQIKLRANVLSLSELEQVIEKIDQAHRLIRQNVNPKIALEVMIGEIEKCKK
ncbi:MAG: DNA polymerase III subunit delta' [Candidatus Omnitrophica bacterium]|nr:DNA polymerase III subunit delta' [Candidatus Omnitrophota bacterium]